MSINHYKEELGQVSCAMLISKSELIRDTVIIMSDLAILTASVKKTLLDISKQAQALGIGLQNAAPGDKIGTPNNSVQYLLDTALNLQECAEECSKLVVDSTHHSSDTSG